MLKVKEKFKGQTLTILGIGCVDFEEIGQPMLKVIHSLYPGKFTEDAKPKKSKNQGDN